jgi:hypothetical protein
MKMQKQLQNIYESAIDANDGSFWSYLADYVELILGSPVLAPKVDELLSIEKEKDEEPFLVKEKLFATELLSAEAKIFAALKNVDFTDYQELLEHYDRIKLGRVHSSATQQQLLHSGLVDILRAFFKLEKLSLVSAYIKIDDQGQILDYNICPSYREYHAAIRDWERRSDRSIWSSWEELIKAYRSYHDISGLRKEGLDSGDRMVEMAASWLISGMDKAVKAGNSDFFKIDKYNQHLARFHAYVLNKAFQNTESLTNESIPSLVIISDNQKTFTLKYGSQKANKPFQNKHRWAHVCYLLVKKGGSMPAPFVTDSDIWEYLKKKDVEYEFKHSPTSDNTDNIRSSIQKHVTTINKQLSKAFPTLLVGVELFKKTDGGVNIDLS